jgi:DNA-binding GntR family transcriptional regulator
MRPTPPRRVLSDDVYDAVLALLLDGEIEPGERANIESIARELDVSPTPVREALARLESEGLVVKRALKGYTAAPPLDAAGFEELFAVRLLLEPHAAALAAARMDDAAQAHLGSATDLHQFIATASGNAVLADAIGRLRASLHLRRLHLDRTVADQEDPEHKRIIAALEGADATAAELSMRTHLDNSRARVATHFRERAGG